MKQAAEKGQGALSGVKAATDERKKQTNAAADSARKEEAAAWEAQGILYRCKSHEEGRNSTVTLYRDRIERVKDRSLGSMSKAKQDAEVIPLRSASSVQAKKDGLVYTKVTVFASGNTVEFRMRHDEAQHFKNLISDMLVRGSAGPSEAPSSSGDFAEQIKKLGELRDEGLLTEEEFQAKKKQLLGL